MTAGFRLFVAASLVAWSSFVAQAFRPSFVGQADQKTTNDGIFSKAQAAGAKKQFDKICAECHAFTAATKKKPKDLPLGDEPFFENWAGRPLSELVTLIALTMPNDGSATVTEKEAVNLVAYMLQQNGFRAGPKRLSKASATAVIERPKQSPKN